MIPISNDEYSKYVIHKNLNTIKLLESLPEDCRDENWQETVADCKATIKSFTKQLNAAVNDNQPKKKPTPKPVKVDIDIKVPRQSINVNTSTNAWMGDPKDNPSRDFDRVDSSELPEPPKDRQEKVGFGRLGQVLFFVIVIVVGLSLSLFLWQKFIHLNCPCK